MPERDRERALFLTVGSCLCAALNDDVRTCRRTRDIGNRLLLLGRYLVIRLVEARYEEHKHLGTHAHEEHRIGSRQMGEFEECTQYDDCSTLAVGVVHEDLTRGGVHPLLDFGYNIHLSNVLYLC